MAEEKTSAEEAAEKARISREESNKKKLADERGSAGAGPGPKAPGSTGQEPNGKKLDNGIAEAAKTAIFIPLNTGTLMITKPGEYNGVYQPPKIMISKSGVSKVDKNNIIKSQWFVFSMLDSIRLVKALIENAEYINQYAEEEIKEMTGLVMPGTIAE